MKNNKGFSLVELIVVIAIMAILAAVAIPTFASFITKANDAADVDFVKQAEYAIELAYAADSTFTADALKVDVDANGKATQIVYGGKTIKAAYKGKTAGDINIDENTTDEDVTQEQIDAANSIDWEYTFKTTGKVAGTYALNSVGKKIEKQNTTTDNEG